MKIRLTPLNILTVLAVLFLVYVLFVTENPEHLDFRGIALVFVLGPLAIDLIFRFIFKDFAKIIVAETILLAVFIVAVIIIVLNKR